MEDFLSKDVRISMLADVYGSLITKRQLQILREYYDDDLSYAEIAEKHNIARQTVKDSLTSATESLNQYEQKLKLVYKFAAIKHTADELLKSGVDSEVKDKVAKLLKQLDIQ